MSRQVNRAQARLGSLVLVLACASVAMAQTPREHVFTANQGAGSVTAFNTDKATVDFTIAGLAAPTEVALNPQIPYGYATEQLGGSVGDFGVDVPRILHARVQLSIPFPFGIAVTPDGRRGFVGNSERLIAVAPAVANPQIGNLQVGAAQPPDPTPDLVSVFDTRTDLELATIDISPLGLGPVDVALSPDGSILFVACATTRNVVLVDTATLALISAVALPVAATQTPVQIAVAPDNSFVYVACFDFTGAGAGAVAFFDVPTQTTGLVALFGVGPLANAANPCDVFLTPDSTLLYVVDASNNVTQVVSVATQATFAILIDLVGRTALSRGTTNEDGTLGYISDEGGSVGDQFSVSGGIINRQFPTGANPIGIAVKAIPLFGRDEARAVQRQRNNTEAQQKGLCFIATASYGDTDEVASLRAFRDLYLMPTKFGASFVDLYYESSPGVANLISSREDVRASVRDGLAPLVFLARLVMSAGTVVPGGLAAVFVLAASIFAGRRLLRRKAA